MDLKQTTTIDLLRMLVDKSERKEAWERGVRRSSYDDAVVLDDVICALADRIDGKDF